MVGLIEALLVIIMKKIIFAKIMIALCIIGIVLFALNAFTGLINFKTTSAVTITYIIGLIIAIFNMVLYMRRK